MIDLRDKDSKIMREKVLTDPIEIDRISTKFGYCPGDIVVAQYVSDDLVPIDGKHFEDEDSPVRCSWVCNRETPISYGRGRYLRKNDMCVVLGFVDSSNGRLTRLLTPECKIGWVKSIDVRKI